MWILYAPAEVVYYECETDDVSDMDTDQHNQVQGYWCCRPQRNKLVFTRFNNMTHIFRLWALNLDGFELSRSSIKSILSCMALEQYTNLEARLLQSPGAAGAS